MLNEIQKEAQRRTAGGLVSEAMMQRAVQARNAVSPDDDDDDEWGLKKGLRARRASLYASDDDDTGFFAGDVAAIGSVAPEPLNSQAQYLQDMTRAINYGGKGITRDSAILIMRITDRLYEGVRAVAFAHKLAEKQTSPIDPQFDVARADLMTPQAVHNFCADSGVTILSALDLAVNCLNMK